MARARISDQRATEALTLAGQCEHDAAMIATNIRRLTVLLLVASLGACAGDGDKKKAEGERREAKMTAVEVKGDTEIEKYDLDGDGKEDVWKYFVRVGVTEDKKTGTRLLAKKELDLNHDGTVDMSIHYNKFGEVVREVMDHDFDGKIDAIDYYLEGKQYKREVKLNFKEQTSVWRYYDGEELSRKEKDTTGNAKPDLFEYYKKGKLVRIGYDKDGDGKPDYYDEVGGSK